MGVLEIAYIALALMGAGVAGSAITGAVLGRERKTGALGGFLWGLLLPVAGLGAVLLSGKRPGKEKSQEKKENGIRSDADRAAREQFARDRPETGRQVRTESPQPREEPTRQQERPRAVRR